MIRLKLVLILVICVGTAFAQGDLAQEGGTIRGQIVDTTEMQMPIEGVDVIIVSTGGEEYTTTTDANGYYVKSGIPAGRYLISIYKKGYGDQVGQPVTVVNGGDHFVARKMTKKDTIVDFFQNPSLCTGC